MPCKANGKETSRDYISLAISMIIQINAVFEYFY